MRILVLLSLFSAAIQAQVVFSRQVYKQHGQSYTQLWEWKPGGAPHALTNSPRAHYQAYCLADGKHIRFSSGPHLNDLNGAWELDLVTKTERRIANHALDHETSKKDGRLELHAAADSNSTSPASAVTVMDPKTGKRTDAGVASEAVLTKDGKWVAFATVRELASFPADSAHSVWVSQFGVFEIATGKRQQMTSGVAYTSGLTVCGR